jgi:hypothetical protein
MLIPLEDHLYRLDTPFDGLPRSLGTVASMVRTSLPGYEIGFHLYASTQAHLTAHCREGAARVIMIDGHKHYLRVR